MLFAASPLVLNEANCVGSDKMLDEEGGAGGDTHFGRVAGNGGDWVELVVVEDKADLRGYWLGWSDAKDGGAIVLSQDPFWASLPRGTIITIIQKPGAEGGMDTERDPADGWVNICPADSDLAVVEGKFEVTNDDWRLTIRDATGQTVFGPVGEAVDGWTGGGVNSREVLALLEDPGPTTGITSRYNGVPYSSFGSANWFDHEGQITSQRLTAVGPSPADSPAPAPVEQAAGQPEATDRPAMELLGTIDVPGWTAEIVGYCASQRVLAVVNPIWKTLDLFLVESFDPPVLEAVDFDEEEPSVEGVFILGTPNSVAVHPTLPVALVVSASGHPREAGWLSLVDLRRATLGRKLGAQPIDLHPDSIAISRDGTLAVIACEAEGDPDTLGSILVVDLRTLTLERRGIDAPLPMERVAGLHEAFEAPAGEVEPEYAAIDAMNRFAAVSVQEQDGVALVDLKASPPRVVNVLWSMFGGQPDGVAILDDMPGPGEPEGRAGSLVAVAEEGMFDRYGQWRGQTLALWWVDPMDLAAAPRLMSRTDVRPLLDPHQLTRRRDPETVLATRLNGRPVVFLTIERGDRILLFDVSDPREPYLLDRVRVGERPEGITLVEHEGQRYLISGDEGDEGPGTISVVRVR